MTSCQTLAIWTTYQSCKYIHTLYYMYFNHSLSIKLPFFFCSPSSHLTRHDQSGGLGSMADPTHMAQLQESLHEMRKDLDQSQDARRLGERAHRQLEAQLKDSQRKYDELFRTKLQLELQV